MRLSNKLFVVFFGVLIFAIGINFIFKDSESDSFRAVSGRVIPPDLIGWSSRELPVGDLENGVSRRILNYDDVFYREFSRDGVYICVYAMSWRQGRISVREIAGHTPDWCWISNGAVALGDRANRRFLVGDRALVPAEIRQYRFPDGAIVNVAWWHFWGRDLVPAQFTFGGFRAMLSEVFFWWGRNFGRKKGQLLVRIHSNMPIDRAVLAPPVVWFLEGVEETRG